MINCENQETAFSLRELQEISSDSKRPLCFWIGAGVGSWINYPRWGELAEKLHNKFKLMEPSYNKNVGDNLLKLQNLPEIFGLCRHTNINRYNKMLKEEFTPKKTTPIYDRFIASVSSVNPTYILTTNVDEMLEKHLNNAEVVSKNDIERIPFLLSSGNSFIGKLHGSISDISSIVFTNEEYNELINNQAFQENLRHTMRISTLIFVGFSLRDKYILDLLSKNEKLGTLFGDGPHFAIVTEDVGLLPKNVKRIEYKSEPLHDHRTPISIIEDIAFLHKSDHLPIEVSSPVKTKSIHLLMDLHPEPDSNETSAFTTNSDDKIERLWFAGEGYTREELIDNKNSALHDIIVGLLCFDQIATSIWNAKAIHNILGGPLFCSLVENDILKLINWKHRSVIMFPDLTSLAGGKLLDIILQNPDGSETSGPWALRRQIIPIPGGGTAAENKIKALEDKVIELNEQGEGLILNTTRSLLLRPSVRNLLGLSHASSVESIAKWQAYPILRLAGLARVAETAMHLGIPSARINFGVAALAGPAFSLTSGIADAGENAGYIVAGTFGADLGRFAQTNPGTINAIMNFRETAAGCDLRKEILTRLTKNEGSDAAIAINTSLQSALPHKILEKAKEELSKLYINQSPKVIHRTAFWTEDSLPEKSLQLWRIRSRKTLEATINQYRIDTFDPCPCGSGEKLKFCCLDAAKTGTTRTY